LGKYGRKHVISDDLCAYNLGIIGESGIGKSTLLKEYCRKVAGDDGYIMLDIGKEDGHDAINDIVSESAQTWDKFEAIIRDIVDNKETDYPELKIVGIDTYDELCTLAEPEIIRRWNEENRDKKDFRDATSIKAVYGGFGAGEKAVVRLILDLMWELKEVGVAFAITGHTKTREMTDPVTGETYAMLTTNADKGYFNAIRTKLHLLGVASIDRDIIRQKTNKKNLKTGQDIVKGKVVSESRIITFRDDNYTIDSKSRFSQIADEIPLDADALIKAMRDAIAKEKGKTTPEEEAVIGKVNQITTKAKELFEGGYEREAFYKAVVNACGTRQFNKLTDIKKLDAVWSAVKDMEVA
jgi:hypothetical protein